MSECSTINCLYPIDVNTGSFCKACFQLRQKTSEAVEMPSHYQIFPGLEAIEVIAMICTKQEFYGYCKGNMLKYRLRAGNKDDLYQDIGKADMYLELYKKHKHLCKPRE